MLLKELHITIPGPLYIDQRRGGDSDQKRGDTPVLLDQKRGDTPVLLDQKRGDTPVLLDQKRGDTPVLLDQKRGDTPVLSDWKRDQQRENIIVPRIDPIVQKLRYTIPLFNFEETYAYNRSIRGDPKQDQPTPVRPLVQPQRPPVRPQQSVQRPPVGQRPSIQQSVQRPPVQQSVQRPPVQQSVQRPPAQLQRPSVQQSVQRPPVQQSVQRPPAQLQRPSVQQSIQRSLVQPPTPSRPGVPTETVPFPAFHNTMSLCYLHAVSSCYLNIIRDFRDQVMFPPHTVIGGIVKCMQDDTPISRMKVQYKWPHLINYEYYHGNYLIDRVENCSMLEVRNERQKFKPQFGDGYIDKIINDRELDAYLNKYQKLYNETQKADGIYYLNENINGKQTPVRFAIVNGIPVFISTENLIGQKKKTAPLTFYDILVRLQVPNHSIRLTTRSECTNKVTKVTAPVVPWHIGDITRPFSDIIKQYYSDETIKDPKCTKPGCGHNTTKEFAHNSVLVIHFNDSDNSTPKKNLNNHLSFKIRDIEFSIIATIHRLAYGKDGMDGHFYGYVQTEDEKWMKIDDVNPMKNARILLSKDEFVVRAADAHYLICIEKSKIKEKLLITTNPHKSKE